MADLNIPNLNIKPDKYIFKKKLNLRRKSKRRLFTESFSLFILSVLLVYINYLIPNKNLLLQNLPSTFNKSFLLLFELFSYLYEIFLVIFTKWNYAISGLFRISVLEFLHIRRNWQWRQYWHQKLYYMKTKKIQ